MLLDEITIRYPARVLNFTSRRRFCCLRGTGASRREAFRPDRPGTAANLSMAWTTTLPSQEWLCHAALSFNYRSRGKRSRLTSERIDDNDAVQILIRLQVLGQEVPTRN
jgi:hypothetical protein